MLARRCPSGLVRPVEDEETSQDARTPAAAGRVPKSPAPHGRPTRSGHPRSHHACPRSLPWFPYLLTIAVLLFAFSTIITWGYYGLKAWTFLLRRSRTTETVYKLLFTAFVALGPVLSLSSLISMADAVLFLLAVINITGLYLLAPIVKKELDSFLTVIRTGISRRSSASSSPTSDV
ncbi:alanine:cation symporter family protein [Streptomyces sp. NPDC056149]|uniref:alanine:cation symporter family protein n=1 Tax=Streptomyces sp. NPDC056149 TaxID=3345728 RepID=UPI0035D5A4B5